MVAPVRALTRTGDIIGYSINAESQLFRFQTSGAFEPAPVGAPLGSGPRAITTGRAGLFFAVEIGPIAAQLFTIDPGSGARTNAPRSVAAATDDPRPSDLDATSSGFGLVFLPGLGSRDEPDTYRLVSSNATNLRISADGSLLAHDSDLTYLDGTPGPPEIVAATFDRQPHPGPATFYGLDAANDTLVTSADPGQGGLRAVGPLGLDISGPAGMAIHRDIVNQLSAYATVTVDRGATYSLRRVNLETGALSEPIATFPAGFEPIGGLALLEEFGPVPDFIPPSVTLDLKKETKTVGPHRKTFRLRGNAFDGGGGVRVLVQERGRKFRPARGNFRWTYRLRLRPGRNSVRVIAIDAAGNRSRPVRVTIIRR